MKEKEKRKLKDIIKLVKENLIINEKQYNEIFAKLKNFSKHIKSPHYCCPVKRAFITFMHAINYILFIYSYCFIKFINIFLK